MSKFIEIHVGDRNSPRLINLNNIRYISGKTIIRTEGGGIDCNESYEEIRRKLIAIGGMKEDEPTARE